MALPHAEHRQKRCGRSAGGIGIGQGADAPVCVAGDGDIQLHGPARRGEGDGAGAFRIGVMGRARVPAGCVVFFGGVDGKSGIDGMSEVAVGASLGRSPLLG